MDLKTNYLGLKLKNPLIAGASPLCDHLDKVRALEDVGVAAITMYSLFEEQLRTTASSLILFCSAMTILSPLRQPAFQRRPCSIAMSTLIWGSCSGFARPVQCRSLDPQWHA